LFLFLTPGLDFEDWCSRGSRFPDALREIIIPGPTTTSTPAETTISTRTKTNISTAEETTISTRAKTNILTAAGTAISSVEHTTFSSTNTTENPGGNANLVFPSVICVGGLAFSLLYSLFYFE
jgi:carbohydrate-binding DOMON domain-containing protein